MANTNSYAENMKNLTESVKDALELTNALNKSISGNENYVQMPNGTEIISMSNIANRIKRVEDTVAKFTQGKGIVETDDGTYRKISVDSVPKPANTITGLPSVTKFDINPNWFFELLQYPRCIVKLDLAGQIEEDSDRVYVNRIVIDVNQSRLTDEIRQNIISTTLDYGGMIDYLEENYIEYKEDKDEVKLPLTYEKYLGAFQITGTSIIKNSATGLNENWYYLSTLNYYTVDENGKVIDSGNVLTIDDQLRFGNSLFKIKSINQTDKRVLLEYSVGYESVGLYDMLELYNDPFSEKVISVGIGIDEINIVYVKGVNEKFNLMSREWSAPVAFFTNDLVYENDSAETFATYYRRNVSDFGKRWIEEAKEGHITSYGGLKPNAPILNGDDLRVVQINTQLDVTLDNERYKQITSEIASTKSNISAVRNTITANKDKLIKESDADSRETIQNTINSDTDKMNNLTTQLSSLVEELNTLLTDAGAISYSPKYHVRGFFSIPEPRYDIDNGTVKEGKQSIIGFETMYRYLHTDETGTALNTFDYTDTSNGITMTGTFTDWNLSVSPFLEKKYNENTDSFNWVEERIDGTSIAINQIDIPIRNGEKVEIKVRSISEAGYPYNPLKSDWSNSVIVDFPDNLTSDDSVTKIVDSVRSDMTAVVLQETLSSAGMYAHVADSNSQYKHDANNIEYTETVTDSSTGHSVTSTISVAEKLRSIEETIRNIARSMGIMLDEYGNITSTEGVALANSPSVEYSFKNGDNLTEYTGKITVNVPNLSDSEKASVNKSLTEFMDSSVLPYINNTILSQGGNSGD